ncbi:hypothetical protein KR093_008457 [Drosophila rubida]|uniref:Mucin-5AC n=1 Tax=Drosophila rubida TaxID=30044 RepID=A0AAD4K5Q8_9MUSC|nr:hypothetical protein KR093_008457 [Drosophila rubida]
MRRMNWPLMLIGCCLLGLEPRSSNASAGSAPSVALTRQAIELGIDAPTLGELWRNKQPVVISKPDALGQLRTTTYSLSPDGSTIIAATRHDELPTTSTSTSTTTTTASPPVSPQNEWEYLPNSLGQRRTSFSSTNLGSDWPSFGSDGFPHTRTLNWPSFEFPAGITPQTSTKTEQDDQGRTVTTTIKSYGTPLFTSSSSWSSTGPQFISSWPSFSIPSGVTPQTSTKTEQDDQGRTVTTTTRVYKPNNWLPETTGELPESWQRRRQPFAGQQPHLLFGNVQPTVAASEPQPQPQPQPQPLPPLPTRPPVAVEPEVTPKTLATFNLDSMPTFRAVNELPTDNTRVTSFTRSFYGLEPPKASELEPQMRDLLDRGGITDDDISKARARGQDVVRTRITPDGRTITTTVRVNSVPVLTSVPQSVPATTRGEDKSIERFLSQVNLSPADIQAQNGEVVKTIVDKDGRVLSAKFVLSTVKGEEPGQGQEPTK